MPTPAKHSVEDVFARSTSPPEWEMLIKDPLLHMRSLPPATQHTISASLPPLLTSSSHRTTTAASSQVRSKDGFIASIPKWELPDPTPVLSKNGKPERRRWIWEEVYAEGREWTFEEIRARREGWLDVNKWEGTGESFFQGIPCVWRNKLTF